MDYEVQRCTRRCAATEKELSPGEPFYSALVPEGAELVRKDFCEEAWKGPPEGAIGWWKSQMPDPQASRVAWAPNEVMLQYFEQLEGQPDKADVRFVLALLLVRRRVFRQEESERDDEGREVIVLYCARREATYKVLAAAPDEPRAAQIQDELAKLLFANAA